MMMNFRKSWLAVLCMVAIPGFCFAAEYTVPDMVATISGAVQQAGNGDTIKVKPGTYIERIDFTGKYIVIQSTDGPEKTIIQGMGSDSVITVQETPAMVGVQPVTISGFTIQNGSGGSGRGGGITLARSADAVIENNVIQKNTAQDGAGILIYQSNPIIRNNRISSNTSTRFGGGLYVVSSSKPTIISNWIEDNTASGPTFTGGGASGGGIYVDGDSVPSIIGNIIQKNQSDFAGGGISLRKNVSGVVEDNSISENVASYGGGIHIETEGSMPQILNNEISANQAVKKDKFAGSGYGGGISVYNQSAPVLRGNTISSNYGSDGGGGIVISENANPYIYANTISSNSTRIDSDYFAGGGIYIANAAVTAINNIIDNNHARIGGGIGFVGNTTGLLVNNTIVNNSAYLKFIAAGGGIFISKISNQVSAQNNILAKNNDFQIYEETASAYFLSNLIENYDRGIYYNPVTNGINTISAFNQSGAIYAEYNIDGDPLFVSLSDRDYHLSSASPAIDQGFLSGSPYDDRDLYVRPYGTGIDIGAYEYAPQGLNRQKTPVYRFWSGAYHGHFFTASKDEKNSFLFSYFPGVWAYEGTVFYAFGVQYSQTVPMYRFKSDLYNGYFYTASEDEKNYVMGHYAENIWKYEGIAWYMYPIDFAGESTTLYRFWSDLYQHHFYTASEEEKDYIRANYPETTWRFEFGVARIPF